jgi:hypothetical protein
MGVNPKWSSVAVFVLLLFYVYEAHAIGCILTWTAPTTRTDGSRLTNLAGYRVYFIPGDEPEMQQRVTESVTTRVTLRLSCRGGSYFVTAFDRAGIESDPSNVVEIIGIRPNVPQEHRRIR